MDPKNVTFLKSLNPITILENSTPGTIDAVARIIEDKKFYENAAILRSIAGLPKEGLSLKEFEGKNFQDIPPLSNDIIASTLKAVVNSAQPNLGLTQEGIDQISLLIFFNAFIDLKYFNAFITHPIEFILGKKNIAAATHDYSHEIGAIFIPYNITKNQLSLWLNDNWEQIDQLMNDNLTKDPNITKIYKYSKYSPEIIYMRDKENKSFQEITDALSIKYPNEELFSDEDHVKKVYYSFRNK